MYLALETWYKRFDTGNRKLRSRRSTYVNDIKKYVSEQLFWCHQSSTISKIPLYPSNSIQEQLGQKVSCGTLQKLSERFETGNRKLRSRGLAYRKDINKYLSEQCFWCHQSSTISKIFHYTPYKPHTRAIWDKKWAVERYRNFLNGLRPAIDVSRRATSIEHGLAAQNCSEHPFLFFWGHSMPGGNLGVILLAILWEK